MSYSIGMSFIRDDGEIASVGKIALVESNKEARKQTLGNHEALQGSNDANCSLHPKSALNV